jgi:predicted transcriptional regulator
LEKDSEISTLQQHINQIKSENQLMKKMQDEQHKIEVDMETIVEIKSRLEKIQKQIYKEKIKKEKILASTFKQRRRFGK